MAIGSGNGLNQWSNTKNTARLSKDVIPLISRSRLVTLSTFVVIAESLRLGTATWSRQLMVTGAKSASLVAANCEHSHIAFRRHECYRVPDESPILQHHTRPPEDDGGSEADIEQLGTPVLTLPVPPDELMLPAQYNMWGCGSDSTPQSFAQHMEETPIYDSTNLIPNAAEHAPDELIAPRKSKRIRKQPIYLQDYVL